MYLLRTASSTATNLYSVFLADDAPSFLVPTSRGAPTVAYLGTPASTLLRDYFSNTVSAVDSIKLRRRSTLPLSTGNTLRPHHAFYHSLPSPPHPSPAARSRTQLRRAPTMPSSKSSLDKRDVYYRKGKSDG